MSHLQRAIEESIATARSLSALEEPLGRAAQILSRCLTSGHKLLACGNGGSASDATHLTTEFLCRFREERRPYPAISLTTVPSPSHTHSTTPLPPPLPPQTAAHQPG